MSYIPNQKHIYVRKKICDTENIYCMINLIALEEAAQSLDAGAFKFWVYLAKNQDEWDFDLSSKHARETFGLKKRQYDNAVAELIEKGFLVKEDGNNYVFYESLSLKSSPEECHNSRKKHSCNKENKVINFNQRIIIK